SSPNRSMMNWPTSVVDVGSVCVAHARNSSIWSGDSRPVPPFRSNRTSASTPPSWNSLSQMRMVESSMNSASAWRSVTSTWRQPSNGANIMNIAVSREDPKFLRVDDAEIVGDGRRELVEPLWHGFAQEAEHGFGKVAEFGVAFVVGDVLVHHFPQPFDRVEMRAV